MKKEKNLSENEDNVDFEKTLMENEDFSEYDYDKILDQIESLFEDEPNEEIETCDSYTEKDGEKLPNLIEGDFSNASLYEKVITNQLLGVFYSKNNYIISDDIKKQLLAIPKKFDERIDNIAYADTEIDGNFLRFKVDFRLGEEYSTAKLFLVEKLGYEFDKRSDTLVTYLGKFVEPTRINFYNRAYTYFNIGAEVDYMEIEKYVDLKGKLSLFGDRKFNPYVLMMLMNGLKDPTTKEFYNALLASATMDLGLFPEMSIGLSLLTNPGIFGIVNMFKLEREGLSDCILRNAYKNEFGKGKGGCEFCGEMGHGHGGHHHHHHEHGYGHGPRSEYGTSTPQNQFSGATFNPVDNFNSIQADAGINEKLNTTHSEFGRNDVANLTEASEYDQSLDATNESGGNLVTESEDTVSIEKSQGMENSIETNSLQQASQMTNVQEIERTL